MSDVNGGQDSKEQNPKPDPNYWRSFKDLYNETSFNEDNRNEFPEGVKEEFDPSKLSSLSRRKFLALVGASAALAGAGCSDYRDKGNIVPYTKKPEEIIVGKANYYASTCTACENGCGILIKTREGRPVKVDGNPDHPVSLGKICSHGHASILNLYDPERLKAPKKNNRNGDTNNVSWKNADADIVKQLNSAGDKEIAVVSHKIISPTTKTVLGDFLRKYPAAKIYSYELVNDEVRKSAWKKMYGTDQYPLIQWDNAKIILSLESDFLGTDGNVIENSRMFAKGRDVNNPDKFNRFYMFESSISLTGSNADYRQRLRPEGQFDLAAALLNEVSKKGIAAVKFDESVTGGITLKQFSEKYNVSDELLNNLSADLIRHKGEAIVYAGNTLPEKTHMLVNLLNEVLGNTSLYRRDTSAESILPLSKKEDFEALISSMNKGNVAVIIHFDSNPVYHLPDDYGYEKALKNVPLIVSLAESENESSVYANYILPVNHNFESWGDAKRRTGFISLQQPVISPIFDTRQKEAILLNWLSGQPEKYVDTIYHDYFMNRWEQEVYPKLNSKIEFKRLWLGALHDGGMVVDESSEASGSFNSASINGIKPNDSAGGLTLALRRSYATGDGKFANNGWMQELPHPVSKITWDNYAAISKTTAAELGLESNDVVEITVENRKHKLPVFIQPGAADDTLVIELGYGRTKTGVVGMNVGFNSGELMSRNGGLSPWIYSNVKIKKTGDTHELVTAQEHHTFDKGYTKDQPQIRNIVREGTLKEYSKNHRFLHEGNEEELESLYAPHQTADVKWGMAIDLNKCTGCGECVIACNSENNIPVVGKDQVKVGREMQWMRIDRYYSGTPEDPKVSAQPMLCQQCDHAPCENVCPVAATTHSPDGLNQMIYNRCVGTRYCSNNCPYKVRRFNFFNFRDHFNNKYQEDKIFSLLYNPEVTVRSRGVMEKCTFCIQRIMAARQEAVEQKRKIKGSDVRTACQDACPTEAIKFGDILDKNEEFYKYRNHELGYYVLEDLNTRPNVTYLAKLRNTHSEEA